jgi:hypothetical protein
MEKEPALASELFSAPFFVTLFLSHKMCDKKSVTKNGFKQSCAKSNALKKCRLATGRSSHHRKKRFHIPENRHKSPQLYLYLYL